MITLTLEKHDDGAKRDAYGVYKDDTRIGTVTLRHIPTKSAEAPPGFESHVGIVIDELHRGKRYGTEAMRLVLKEAKKTGHTEVLLTIKESNIASRTVAERNGAVFVEQAPSPVSGEIFHRYRILLT